jgi:Fe-S-cluster containining protein
MTGMDGTGIAFECLRCGRCCTDLLAEDMGVLRGLTLLPGEQGHFPEPMVSPAIGLGRRPHERGFRVIAYQLTVNTCPHLGENACNIYVDRPASCRQYPFSLGRGSDGSELMGFDLNCPSLLMHLGKDPRARFRFEARQYAERLRNAGLEAVGRPNRAWFFDLESKKWIRYSELSES